MLNVSERGVRDAKVILKTGDAELINAVEAGEISVQKAAETVRSSAGEAKDPAPAERTTKAVADANREKVLKQDARYRQKEIRDKFKALKETEQQEFLATVIGVDDVVAQFATMLDSQRRQIADAAFSAIASFDERLRHYKIVRAWFEQHEGSERA